MTNPNFTPAQLIAIRDGLFGTLDSDFNYGMGKPKRQAAIAKWQKATNFDALMQRAKKQEAQQTLNTPAMSALVHPAFIPAGDITTLAKTLNIEPEAFFAPAPVTLTVTCENSGAPYYKNCYTVQGIELEALSPALTDVIEHIIDDNLPDGKTGLLIITTLTPDSVEHDFARFDHNTNDNCLSGIQCPCCGNNEAFNIDTLGIHADDVDPMMSQSGIMRAASEGELESYTFSAHYTDDGTEDVAGDSEFAPDGEASCCDCGYTRKTSAFYATHPDKWTGE